MIAKAGRRHYSGPVLVLIDNYDSFTYNLVQAFETLGEPVEVVRNDAATPEEVERRAPGRIVVSPGPCTPREAGISTRVLERMAGRVPILGVCLGHQCIARAWGAEIRRARRPMHGKTSTVRHDGAGVFAGVPNPVTAMRYHSLAVDEASLPEELAVTARDDAGEIMGLRHRRWPVEGVQFHPESYRTEAGLELLRNFLKL
jgi:anthranilate synthase/aminodeoxychorismate synthase-like glutamine amidotransferase